MVNKVQIYTYPVFFIGTQTHSFFHCGAVFNRFMVCGLTSSRLSVETGEAGRQRDKVAVCKTKQKVPKSDSF